MKVLINKKFTDRYTKKVYKVGETIEVTEERYAEIKKTNAALVTAVQDDTEDTNLEDMTVAQLKELAESLGIATTTKMKKSELIDLIEAANAETE